MLLWGRPEARRAPIGQRGPRASSSRTARLDSTNNLARAHLFIRFETRVNEEVKGTGLGQLRRRMEGVEKKERKGFDQLQDEPLGNEEIGGKAHEEEQRAMVVAGQLSDRQYKVRASRERNGGHVFMTRG
eukprot:1371319-Amorphochlora_amoeboformis.AAC.1